MLNYDEFKRELLKRVREKTDEDVTVEILLRTKDPVSRISQTWNNISMVI